MRRSMLFVGIGTVTALAVEASFNLLAAHTPQNFLFTIFFYPLYLALFYLLQKNVLSRVALSPRAVFLLMYVLGGIFGLAIEWFIIGNSPWNHPEALQWGMWAYWVSLTVVPTIYLADRDRGRQLLWSIVLLYGGVAIMFAWVFPSSMQVAVQPIWQTIFFTALHIPYLVYLRSLKT